MKKRILFLALLFALSAPAQTAAAFVYADTSLDILGADIPIIEGASTVTPLVPAPLGAKIASFIVNKPLDEVANFYSSFLKENAFMLIGGLEQGGAFNAAAKKGDAQFSIRIYAQDEKTYLECVW